MDQVFNKIDTLCQAMKSDSTSVSSEEVKVQTTEHDIESLTEIELSEASKQSAQQDQLTNMKTVVINEVLAPNMKKEIEYLYKSITRWHKIANTVETLATVMALTSTMVSFSAGYWENYNLSYLAGIIGVANLSLAKCVAYSRSQSSERTNELNQRLKDLGIGPISVLENNTQTKT